MLWNPLTNACAVVSAPAAGQQGRTIAGYAHPVTGRFHLLHSSDVTVSDDPDLVAPITDRILGARTDARTHQPPCMELTEELIEEIFFRVPTDEPAYLVRAALVCKSWRRILCDRGFLRRYRVFHSRTPPPLGYLHNLYFQGPIPRFVRTSAASPAFTTPPSLVHNKSWRALDCRHGRVLARTLKHDDRLVVWDPMTGDQKHLSVPAYPNGRSYNGAVLCAAAVSKDDGPDGCCDHLGSCCPFVVVFIVADADRTVRASVYSSETNAWSAPSPAVHVDHLFDDRPSLLAGGAIHFAIVGGKSILKYNLVGHRLLVIDTPPPPPPLPADFALDMVMTRTKDGGLGFAAVVGGCVYLWTRTQPTGGWAQHKAMETPNVTDDDPTTSGVR
ncbi:hypothetical protein HU200_026357 [Digitaria exilis]|uniref:F-box domain-containing protein n=1 Tax=Digitaria exilis TaxID=1010633 RepID=A0A835C7E0_9POAL|nr:hypothetical protein HU200_026357 [Digitaria exilis]